MTTALTTLAFSRGFAAGCVLSLLRALWSRAASYRRQERWAAYEPGER